MINNIKKAAVIIGAIVFLVLIIIRQPYIALICISVAIIIGLKTEWKKSKKLETEQKK